MSVVQTTIYVIHISTCGRFYKYVAQAAFTRTINLYETMK